MVSQWLGNRLRKHVSQLGKPDVAARPLDQLIANKFFQDREMPADGALGGAQGLRRLCDARFARNLGKRAQCVQRDGGVFRVHSP